MRVATLDPDEQQARLADSIERLTRLNPIFSGVEVMTRSQRRVLLALGAVVVMSAIITVGYTAIALIGLATLLYGATIVNRVMLFVSSLRAGSVEVVTDIEARSVSDEALPSYTVLIPAYREPEVIPALLAAIEALDYPHEKLEVKVLLEADDDATIDAARKIDIGSHAEIVLVPPAEPRTKPKALNYGLAITTGELVTIFDAEDIPDRLQLRRAAVALRRLSPSVACVQSELSFRNADQNLLTRWFTIEYAMWFQLFLPGLVSKDAPLPLGGTSNHFRRDALETTGAWDPHNVTEDADLGVRLHRRGFTVRVLGSTTLEEANSDFVNWIKQRSRWYKGYLQTWLVHMRRPKELYREIGPRAFVHFNLFVGGTPLLALLNPVFWTMTLVWFIGKPEFIRAVFPAAVFYTALLCFTVGNFVVFYLGVLTIRITDQPPLLLASLVIPAYWVMMSMAAVKAFIQLVFAPTFWEKTTHGLDVLHRHRSS